MIEEIQEVQKEPWEMTQKEVIDQARKSKGWSTKTSAGWRSKTFTGVVSEHRAAVKEALKEGKPVPVEVLESYPELLKPDVNIKPGDHVVVQGLKDTYEGMVTSVRDNTFWLSTPQFVKMQWSKGDIIEIIPGEGKEEIGGSEPKSNRGRHQGQASVGYLK
jgi:hypothetical protein